MAETEEETPMTSFRTASAVAIVLGLASGPAFSQTCTVGSPLPWCQGSMEFAEALDVQTTDRTLAIGSRLPRDIKTVEVVGGDGYEVARVNEQIVIVPAKSREIADLIELP
jgi:hypothetical protein